MQIRMIVGSEMGNAEMVGDLVKDELEALVASLGRLVRGDPR